MRLVPLFDFCSLSKILYENFPITIKLLVPSVRELFLIVLGYSLSLILESQVLQNLYHQIDRHLLFRKNYADFLHLNSVHRSKASMLPEEKRGLAHSYHEFELWHSLSSPLGRRLTSLSNSLHSYMPLLPI